MKNKRLIKKLSDFENLDKSKCLMILGRFSKRFNMAKK
jgi:hypothetical protein